MKKLGTLLLLVLVFNFTLPATTYITSGQGSGLWQDPASWRIAGDTVTPRKAPAPTDDVVIGHYLTHAIDNSYVHLGKLTVTSRGFYELMARHDTAATFTYAGPRMEVQGTLILGGHFAHVNQGELILGPAAWVLIGGRADLRSSGGVLNLSQSCGGVEIVRDLRVAVDQTFLAGQGKMVVWGALQPYHEYRAQPLLDRHQALSPVLEPQAQIFSSTDQCQAGRPEVQGTLTLETELQWEGTGVRQAESGLELQWRARAAFGQAFIVERSRDGLAFEKVAELPLELTQSRYRVLLPRQAQASAYYRVRLTNLQGRAVSTPVKRLSVDAEPRRLTLYPNPYQGGSLHLQAKGLQAEQPTVVQVHTLTGRQVAEQVAYLNQPNGLQLTTLGELPPGVYSVTLLQGHRRYTQRLIVR